jgi:hypothetical protein
MRRENSEKIISARPWECFKKGWAKILPILVVEKERRVRRKKVEIKRVSDFSDFFIYFDVQALQVLLTSPKSSK